MKKSIIVLILLCSMLFSGLIYPTVRYYEVSLSFDNTFGISEFLHYGFDIESIIKDKDGITFIADSEELKFLDLLKVNYKIVSNEIAGEYLKKSDLLHGKNSTGKILELNEFQFGSMNGYYTYEESYEQFDSITIKYPEFVKSIDTIGYSFENRPIVVYEFANHDNDNQVLFTALHHAREPGGVSVILYFLNDLLSKAKSGEEVANYLLKTRTLFVIPVVNPDGFLFNQKNNPKGGGLWRKNRRLMQDSIFGVDLNRNYGPFEFWNAPINGSSTKPNDYTYRGTEPFSEPETQAVRDFILSKNIKICLNFHTHGNLLLYPYSAQSKETKDSSFFRNNSEQMSKDNRYIYGLDFETVNYSGRGVSDDWMYWTGDGKTQKVMALTPEIGKPHDGFWTTPDRILEHCKENLSMLYNALWSAEVNWVLNNYEISDIGQNLKLEYRNIGLLRSDNRIPEITLKPLDSNVVISNIVENKSKDNFILNADLSLIRKHANGEKIRIEVVAEEPDYTKRDTIEINIGTAGNISLFKDEELYGKWKMGNWNKEFSAERQRFVLADSPGGHYTDSSYNYLETIEPLILNFNYAELLFDASWQIETNYDFATVEISDDSAKTWKKLDARRMITGPGVKGGIISLDETGFSGYSHKWISSKIPLDDYTGKNVLIRFGMLADKGARTNGIFLDNIRIKVYPDISSVSDDHDSELIVYPNPSRADANVYLQSKYHDFKILDIMDLVGNKFRFRYDESSGSIFIENELSGIYLLKVEQNTEIKVIKLIRY